MSFPLLTLILAYTASTATSILYERGWSDVSTDCVYISCISLQFIVWNCFLQNAHDIERLYTRKNLSIYDNPPVHNRKDAQELITTLKFTIKYCSEFFHHPFPCKVTSFYSLDIIISKEGGCSFVMGFLCMCHHRVVSRGRKWAEKKGIQTLIKVKIIPTQFHTLKHVYDLIFIVYYSSP